ncbi:class I SAM-dependent methyltransferase [Ekhidna sp.]
MKYRFEEISHCNMCQSKTDSHKILGRRLNKSQGKNPKNKIGLTTTVCKCSNCGLIYSNPQPIPLDIQDHYGVPPEDYWKEEYFQQNPDYFVGEIKQLKQLIDFKAGMKSLDIGAGLGKQMLALENIGFDAYGLEPSVEFHKRATSKMGIKEEKLKLGMIEELEYEENQFDFISFGVVLEHLYDPSKALEKAMKWLKKDGIIHIEVPSSNWFIGKLINKFYRFKLTDFVGNISPMHEPYHLYEFSLESFTENSKINQFSIAHFEYYVCQTFLPRVFNRFLIPYMDRTNQGMQLCVWLRKN